MPQAQPTELLRRVLLAAALLLLAACGAEPAQTARPALWEVSGPDGSRGWLFGAVHALPDDLHWQTPALAAALGKADRLVLEIGPADKDAADPGQVFARLGTTPGLPPVAARVRPGLRDDLARQASAGVIDLAKAAPLENWAVAITLAQALASRQGHSPEHGVEAVLSRHAGQLPVEGLETIAGQFAVFDRLPAPAQTALLESVVAEGGDPAAGDQLIAAWARGDMEALARETRRGMMADPALRAALLSERNTRWAQRIDAMLNARQRPFVAVGAAHVAGDDGLPALLQARGWTVRRVQ